MTPVKEDLKNNNENNNKNKNNFEEIDMLSSILNGKEGIIIENGALTEK